MPWPSDFGEDEPPVTPIRFWSWLLYWGHGRVAVIVLFGAASIVALIVAGVTSLIRSLV
jgi:hypothetical protein